MMASLCGVLALSPWQFEEFDLAGVEHLHVVTTHNRCQHRASTPPGCVPVVLDWNEVHGPTRALTELSSRLLGTRSRSVRPERIRIVCCSLARRSRHRKDGIAPRHFAVSV